MLHVEEGMGRPVGLYSSAHVQVGQSKVATVLGYEVRDFRNHLVVEHAQPKVLVLISATVPVDTAQFLSLIRFPATCPLLSSSYMLIGNHTLPSTQGCPSCF